MREARILYFALGVLLVVAVGAVSLHDTGIRFPDGSFQATAGGFTAATAVQGRVSIISGADPSAQCGFGVLYSVPANTRLVVEWVAVETSIWLALSGSSHPADVHIITHDGSGQVFYPFTRLQDGASLGGLLFGAPYSAPVRLYSEAGQDLEARICINTILPNELLGSVGFSGYLVDV